MAQAPREKQCCQDMRNERDKSRLRFLKLHAPCLEIMRAVNEERAEVGVDEATMEEAAWVAYHSMRAFFEETRRLRRKVEESQG